MSYEYCLLLNNDQRGFTSSLFSTGYPQKLQTRKEFELTGNWAIDAIYGVLPLLYNMQTDVLCV